MNRRSFFWRLLAGIVASLLPMQWVLTLKFWRDGKEENLVVPLPSFWVHGEYVYASSVGYEITIQDRSEATEE